MNEKISKIKLELLKEEFIKQIKDGYTFNLSIVLLEEFENLQQENQQLKEENSRLKIKCRKIKKELKEEIKVLELIIGLRQKRNLIHKFDKEYDEEDKKKNPNRDYAGIIPDAEEVYKRYYEQQKRINKAIEYISEQCLYDEETKNFNDDLDYYEIAKLMEILKGGENE